MRCSICMSQLIEKDDAVVCPNCQYVQSAAAIPAYQSDFDDNIEKPDSLVTTLMRSTLWALGVLCLVTLGGVGGWTLRGAATGWEDFSLLRVASTVLDQSDAVQRSEASPSIDPASTSFERFLFAPRPKQDNLTVVGIGAPNGAYRFLAHASGSADTATLLEVSDQISPIEAAQFEDGTLALLSDTGEQFSIIAWSEEGVRLWQTDLDLQLEPAGLVKMQALGAGLVVVAQDPQSNQAVAQNISIDGSILWTLDLGHSAASHLSIYKSPFEELVVLTRASSNSSELRVQSLTLEGLSGLSVNFPIRDNEQILAATVDSIGQIQILLSGAPPRLLTQDALGRTSQSQTLDALHAIPRHTPCLLESRSQHLRVACVQNDVLGDTVLNLTTANPEVTSRTTEPLEEGSSLIAIYEDSAIAIESNAPGAFNARAVSVRAIPEPGDVSIPEDATVGFP